MKFSNKLALLLDRRGVSKADVARAVGVHPSRVSEWLGERGNPTMQTGLRLARVLGVTLDYLADDDQDDPPESRGEAELKLLEIAEHLPSHVALNRLLFLNDDGSPRKVTAVDPGPAPDVEGQHKRPGRGA